MLCGVSFPLSVFLGSFCAGSVFCVVSFPFSGFVRHLCLLGDLWGLVSILLFFIRNGGWYFEGSCSHSTMFIARMYGRYGRFCAGSVFCVVSFPFSGFVGRLCLLGDLWGLVSILRFCRISFAMVVGTLRGLVPILRCLSHACVVELAGWCFEGLIPILLHMHGGTGCWCFLGSRSHCPVLSCYMCILCLVSILRFLPILTCDFVTRMLWIMEPLECRCP